MSRYSVTISGSQQQHQHPLSLPGFKTQAGSDSCLVLYFIVYSLDSALLQGLQGLQASRLWCSGVQNFIQYKLQEQIPIVLIVPDYHPGPVFFSTQ